jgi:hypothetical protein
MRVIGLMVLIGFVARGAILLLILAIALFALSFPPDKSDAAS